MPIFPTTPLTKQEIIARIQRVLPELRQKYPIGSLGLFGSYVRDEAKADSDVDVLVEFDGKVNLFDYLQMEIDLAEAIGMKTDLVTRKGLKPALRDRILSQVESLL